MTGSSRILELASLPLFHKLEGRRVVVVGTSEPADWKAELLAAARAEVVRLADEWSLVDLDGAALAIADLPDRDEAARFAAAARAAGVVVNVIDQPDFSDVQFGTIVNRSPLVIGISTDGAAPMLGQSIRTKIESVIPASLTDWTRAAKQWRPRLKQRITDFGDRRKFWQRFVDLAWRSAGRKPAADDFDALVDGISQSQGRVTLVGAGPGDPELLTLKAVRALQTATVILHDRLIGPEVLELARREARRIAVGKEGHGPSCTQAEINAQMIELALAGENVVRLKGGDPMIFGRATEEIEACKAAGVEVSVIPGISAVQGAAAALKVSLTERRHARRFQLVTGHGADGKLPGDIDWSTVGDRKVTTALYMPRKTLGEFVRLALAQGVDPTTPAIAIASATLPEQVHVVATITDIEAATSDLPPSAPVVIIIGWVGRQLVTASARVLPFARVAS